MRIWKRRGPSAEAKSASSAAVRSKCRAEIDKWLAHKAWTESMADIEQARANYKAALDGCYTVGIAGDK